MSPLMTEFAELLGEQKKVTLLKLSEEIEKYFH